MVMQFLVTSAARKCFRCFVGGMVGVPNTIVRSIKSFWEKIMKIIYALIFISWFSLFAAAIAI